MTIAASIQKVQSLWYEWHLGIRTVGNIGPVTPWGVHYTPLPYHIAHCILDQMSLKSADVFVDVGCGKGRVLCCACRLVLRKVVGIEVNPVLVDLARRNASVVRGQRSLVEVLEMPAEEYDYSDATGIYLYNPFGAPIMEKVCSRIDESCRRHPRKVQLVYANPLHENCLGRIRYLEKTEEWPGSKFPAFGCAISFWRSKTMN